MSDSEDEAVEKQLKIVVVGEAGSGKVKNSGPIQILRGTLCAVHVCSGCHFGDRVLDTCLVEEVLLWWCTSFYPLDIFSWHLAKYLSPYLIDVKGIFP